MWISQFRHKKFPLRALWQHSFVLNTGLNQFPSRGLKPPVIIDLIPHTLILSGLAMRLPEEYLITKMVEPLDIFKRICIQLPEKIVDTAELSV